MILQKHGAGATVFSRKNDLQKGTILKRENIEALRPCPSNAINPNSLNEVIGKKLRYDLNKGEYLQWKDLI